MIHIQAKEKSFYIRILDDVGRIIYENQCVNQLHYEFIRYVLAKWISGEKIDNSMLKPLKETNMVTKNPIYCPNCKKVVVEDDKQLMHYCMTEDLKCPHCGTVVITCSKVTY